MRKLILTMILGGSASFLGIATCNAQTDAPQSARPHEIAYGADPLQRLDYWPAGTPRAPLIVFIHGGGWQGGDKSSEAESPKVAYFRSRGFAFSALNYRLVPQVSVGGQVQDVANALAFLVGRANALGFDPRRIILVGHSSGGHLAALVGTDPRYLRQAGLDISSVAGVILLDGAGLVPRTGAEATRRRGPFASEEERQALAPVNHVAAPNAARFLMLNASSEDLRQQARTLADGLNAAGSVARVQSVDGTDHEALSADLGRPGDAATALVEDYLNGFVASRR